MGMTKIDVHGEATLRVTLIRKDTGESLIDKDYSARIEEKMSKLKCDTPSTRSKMAGKALKSVMEQFKADLAQVVRSMEAANTLHPESKYDSSM